MKRLTALLLVAVLLCGCGATNSLGFHGVVKFEDMEYTRPDMDTLASLSQAACDAAENGVLVDEVLDAVWEYYDAYDEFCTNYDLAYIHYHSDLSDEYWKTEHDFCAENSAQIDVYLEDIYYAIAASPLRDDLEEEYFGEGYFEAYDGESVYDDTLLSYLEQEQALISEYYTLSEAAQSEEYYSEAYFEACAEPMAQVLVELIGVRQKMARYAGYGSYPAFAYDNYYYRDYTWAQASAYLEDIQQTLVPLYRNMNGSDAWDYNDKYCSEQATFDYVKEAAQNMGGVTAEAFELLEEAELYDISASPNKSGISFELFLYRYYQPFVFTSSVETQYDKLTFAHEFGHFACDYAAAGSYAGTDVLEIFSQGMEYLSLCYTEQDQALIDMKLADSLATYVEQAAYAAFEHEMYELEGSELTTENLFALYEEICMDYGFDSMDWDPRDLVTVPHFYGNPLYIISYVVSNDAAMQLYELELAEPGAGKQCFEENLTTEEYDFLSFLESAGLEDPFREERLDAVRDLMAQRFG